MLLPEILDESKADAEVARVMAQHNIRENYMDQQPPFDAAEAQRIRDEYLSPAYQAMEAMAAKRPQNGELITQAKNEVRHAFTDLGFAIAKSKGHDPMAHRIPDAQPAPAAESPAPDQAAPAEPQAADLANAPAPIIAPPFTFEGRVYKKLTNDQGEFFYCNDEPVAGETYEKATEQHRQWSVANSPQTPAIQ